MQTTHNSISISTLISEYLSGSINIPNFQRSFVYDERRISDLVISVLTDIPIPCIILVKGVRQNVEGIWCDPQRYLTDGYQRTESFRRFRDNLVPLKSKDSSLNKKYYKDLPAEFQTKFDQYLLSVSVVTCDMGEDAYEVARKVFCKVNQCIIVSEMTKVLARTSPIYQNFVNNLRTNKSLWSPQFLNFKHTDKYRIQAIKEFLEAKWGIPSVSKQSTYVANLSNKEFSLLIPEVEGAFKIVKDFIERCRESDLIRAYNNELTLYRCAFAFRGVSVPTGQESIIFEELSEAARSVTRAKFGGSRDRLGGDNISANLTWNASDRKTYYELIEKILSPFRKRERRTLPQNVKTRAYSMSRGICAFCNKPVSQEAAVFHHIVPVYEGGTDDPGNIQCVHKECHQAYHAAGGCVDALSTQEHDVDEITKSLSPMESF